MNPLQKHRKINRLFADVTAETSLQVTRELVELGLPARETFLIICDILADKAQSALTED